VRLRIGAQQHAAVGHLQYVDFRGRLKDTGLAVLTAPSRGMSGATVPGSGLRLAHPGS
jgi:hypothetical protein